MSWRTDYRIGSFRGVPFRSQNSEREGGRRGETHEYPRRDAPWGEDLGRRARRFTLDVFVAGEDCFAQRDALLDALEAPGPGTLVHPWAGTQAVRVESYSAQESTEDGGVAFFNLTFVETAEPAQAAVAADTAGSAIAAADAAIAEAPAAFADRFSIDGVADFVEDAGVALIAGTGRVTMVVAGLQGGSGSVLRDFEGALAYLPNNARMLLRSPLALARAVVDLMQAAAILGRARPDAGVAGLSLLLAVGEPQLIGATPARVRQATNAVAWDQLVGEVAAAELVRLIATIDFASYQDAAEVRDRVAALIDARAVVAADRGDDRAAAAFDRLHRVLVVDVTARGGTLARVYAHVPAVTEPALVIAHRLYGTGTIAREADLIARNRIRHPNFVTGGRSIEVLEATVG